MLKRLFFDLVSALLMFVCFAACILISVRRALVLLLPPLPLLRLHKWQYVIHYYFDVAS